MQENGEMNRRDFVKAGAIVLGGAALASFPNKVFADETKKLPQVYYCKDITKENLIKIYDKVNASIQGKVAIKLHTGEKGAPNLPPRFLAQALQGHIPNSTIVECNVLYPGPRFTTESHRELLKENGWTFCPVDILDEEGTTMLPVKGGKWFNEISVGGSNIFIFVKSASPIPIIITLIGKNDASTNASTVSSISSIIPSVNIIKIV